MSGSALVGTPATAETETVLVQAQDSQGTKASAFLTLAVAASGAFIPQPGYGFSGTVADGSSFTITKSGGGWGSKPIDPRPLLFIDPAVTGSISPSPLGRTTATNNNNNISYVSTGGPSGTGWAKGAPVVSGDTGTQKAWTLAIDVDQWGTSTPSPAINDLGAKYYLYRQVFRNFAHYDENTANFNCKNWRIYGRSPDTLNSPQALPDMYMSTSNQRLTQEGGPTTPNQDFTRNGQPVGSTDYIAQQNIIQFDGGLPGAENATTFNNWYSEEFVTQANQNNPSTTPPTPDNTSFLWNWFVEGMLSNQAAFTTPVFTYQWNQWYMKGTGIGRIMRYYFWQYIVDGTAGRQMLPLGSYFGFGTTLLDDSSCRVHMRNSSARASFTKNEPLPTSAWATGSITVTLRKGRFASYSGNSLIVTDNNGTEYYVGDFA